MAGGNLGLAEFDQGLFLRPDDVRVEARGHHDRAERAAPAEFRLRLDTQALNEETLDRLEQLLAGTPGPCPVVFELRSPDGSVALLQAQQRVRANAELVEAVRLICGEQAIEMVMG